MRGVAHPRPLNACFRLAAPCFWGAVARTRSTYPSVVFWKGLPKPKAKVSFCECLGRLKGAPLFSSYACSCS